MEMESGFFFLSWVLKGGIPDRSSDSVAYWEGKLRQNLEPDLAFSMSGQMGVSSTSSCVDPEVPLTREELQLQTPLLNSTLHPVLLPGSPRHSLRYSCRRVSESSQKVLQFHSVVLLDDQPIARNCKDTSSVELLVPWMGAEDKNILVDLERVLRAYLEWLSNHNHQTEGLHTWQAILGCGEDGSKGGFLNYSHDGMDFVSFDKKTLRWMTGQPQAQKVKEKWDYEPWRTSRNKGYLEERCIKMMQKYLPHQTESLKKTEPPLGKVTCKVVNDSLEALICQAFGFYPKEIQATWTRDGEACKYETLHRNVAPNSDGTYYVRLTIELDPKERDRFRCHLEDEDLNLKEDTGGVWWIPSRIVATVGIVPIMMSHIFISFLIYRQRRRLRRKFWYVAANLHLPQINRSPATNGTEDETQSQMLP